MNALQHARYVVLGVVLLAISPLLWRLVQRAGKAIAAVLWGRRGGGVGIAILLAATVTQAQVHVLLPGQALPPPAAQIPAPPAIEIPMPAPAPADCAAQAAQATASCAEAAKAAAALGTAGGVLTPGEKRALTIAGSILGMVSGLVLNGAATWLALKQASGMP